MTIEQVASDFAALIEDANRRAVEDAAFEIRVFDRNYNLLGYCGDYLETRVEFASNRIGTTQITVPGDSPWGRVWMRCEREVIPVVVEVNGKRWSGRVDTCDRIAGDTGVTYVATCISDWAWLHSILAWPSPFLPIQTQFPKHDIAIGPAITVLKGYLQKNLLRLQQPLWSVVNNFTIGGLVSSLGGIFAGSFRPVDFQNYDEQKANDPLDPNEWLRGIANRANFPVAVKPADPFRDSSTWVALTARMTPMDELFEDVLRDEGLLLTADLWLPGEDDPIPGLNLTAPTIVLDIVDKTYATGPNGNILTGLFRAALRVLEDGVTKVIVPQPSAEASQQYSLSGFFGTDPADPWVVFRDSDTLQEDTGVISSRITAHHPMAKHCVIGGRSPSWLNQGVNLLIESALSLILSFVGQSGISSTILNGILDDVFMAWDVYRDQGRNNALGPYGFHEHFSAGGSVALSFSGLMNGRAALWETRGYQSFEFQVDDRAPYQAFTHFDLKDPVGVEVPDLGTPDEPVIYLQYVDSVSMVDSRSERVHTTITIGDPSANEDPVVKALRKVRQVTSFVNALFLNTQ